MELKDFIQETLSQIAAGVEAAQTEVRDAGGFVNPAHRTGKQEADKSHFGALTSGQNIFLVDFDVTVSVIEATETDGRAKLNVAGFMSLGTGGQSNASSTATNRISFKVPLAMPVDAVSAEELKKQDAALAERRRKQSEAIRQHNQRNSGSWMG
ncbi:MAG TPA: hypothetical protein PKL53_08525 [Methylotenera sp.]|nr:hypothetical protein [Methylotenera sp.]HPV45266.1 hypothetical protein [Methylotenera sp.]